MTDRWSAGVLHYAEMGYWQPDYVPKPSDLLAAFRVTPQAGVDHLHAGTVVGKLEGDPGTVAGFYDTLRCHQAEPDPAKGLYFEQDWVSMPGPCRPWEEEPDHADHPGDVLLPARTDRRGDHQPARLRARPGLGGVGGVHRRSAPSQQLLGHVGPADVRPAG